MATDNVNITEDTEMADCEADKVVTMVDVLQEQQDFEEDANAVLGASDANNCTYSQGYIKRQAIYACLTCCPESKTDPNKKAGVCLACSLNCHENHELIELYTKRNFRCDCGNPKFNSNSCQFTVNKDELNSNNEYNHNFSGVYCTCKRPYPDPEATDDEDMIQCIICEDWHHASHLNAVIPPNDQYAEMICKGCMDRNEFLHDYSSFAINIESIDVDVITVNVEKPDASLLNGNVTNEVGTHNSSGIQTDISNGVDVGIVSNEIETGHKNEGHTPNNKESSNDQTTKENSTKSTLKENGEMETEILKEGYLPTTTNNKAPENVGTNSTNPDSSGQSTDSKSEVLKDPGSETKPQNESTTGSNKTEKNILDDIKQLTSEQTIQNGCYKENIPQTSESPAVVSEIETYATNSENLTSNLMTESINDKIEEVLKANDKSVNMDVRTDPETNSVEVSSTLKENIDRDNDDTVMDAIDELLEGHKETTTNETEDKNEQASKDFVPNDNNETGTNIPNNTTDAQMSLTGDMNEKHNTVVEMAIDETVEEPLENSVNTENKDSIQQTNVDMADNMCLNEQSDTSVNSEKKDSILATNNNVKTDTDVEMTNNESLDKQLDTLVDSKKEEIIERDKIVINETNENTINEDMINENQEVTDKTADPQVESSVKSEKKDSILPANNNVKTDTDVEMTNNKSLDKQLDTLDNSKKSESIEREKIVINEAHENQEVIDRTTDPQVESASTNENKRRLSVDMTNEISKKAKIDKCNRPKGVAKVFKGATFWPPNFRQLLCTCGECLSMYKDLQVLFLIDVEDTVSFYESLGKQKVDGGTSQYERGLEALSSLDRIQQINALTEYNNMRDRLLDFLKSFKDRQEVVKEEDIKAFFAGMKPRREPDGVYFCR